MKDILLPVVLIIAFLFMGIFGYKNGWDDAKNRTDLPEEIKTLSTDMTRPDTLIGYQSNGVIHIGFKH